MNNEQVIIPILRWAGSKRKLLSKLIPYWGSGHTRYFEPFAGSAALFFALRPSVAVLSDTNSELIETLALIRGDASAVYEKLVSFPEGKRSYYRLRSLSPRRMAPIARAARFVFMNRFCFNGLYRTDKQGKFNVPFASSGTGNLPSWDQFRLAASALNSATLYCADFEAAVMSRVRRGDFVYLDPPYAVGNRRIFRQYGPGTFGLEDLERLGALLNVIDRRGAHFVLSYAYCREAKDEFFRWPHKRVFTTRNISGFAKHRRRAAEMIISNIQLAS